MAEYSKKIGEPFIEPLTVEGWNGVNEVFSSILDKRRVGDVLLLVKNSTNQSVSVSVYGSDTQAFTDSYQLSGTLSIASSGLDYAKVEEPWPFLRIGVTPAAAPTGTLSVKAVDGSGRR